MASEASQLIDVVSCLKPGEVMENGKMLRSSNKRFTLHMQGDGKLVVYDEGSTPLWDSRSQNKGCQPFRLEMKKDNNLCIYDGTGKCTWASQTQGCGGAEAWVEMQVIILM